MTHDKYNDSGFLVVSDPWQAQVRTRNSLNQILDRSQCMPQRAQVLPPAGRCKSDQQLDNLIAEHERLVHVLETPDHGDDRREAKRQARELERYKRERANKAGK